MLYNLSKNTTDKLLDLPETGFGYQVISACLKETGLLQKYVVFNAEIAIEFDSNLNFYTNTLIGYCYQILRNSLMEIELTDIQLLSSVNQLINIPENLQNSKLKLIRPTIFLNDNRIDTENNCLIPGSCITTLNQYLEYLELGKDIFDIYAFPQQDELKRKYFFDTESNQINYLGKYEAYFNKNGGGEKYLNLNPLKISSEDSIYPMTNISPSYRKIKIKL